MGRGLGNSGKPGGHGISAFHWRVRDGLTGKGKEAREHGPSGKRGRQRPESQSCSCPRTGKVASEAGAKGTERVADEHRRVTTTSRRAAGPWREGRGHCGVRGAQGRHLPGFQSGPCCAEKGLGRDRHAGWDPAGRGWRPGQVAAETARRASRVLDELW